MASGLQSFECERCGAALTPTRPGEIIACAHCKHPYVHTSDTRSISGSGPGAGAGPSQGAHGRSRASLLIVVGFAVVGLVIAVGGATAILWMRGRAPDDAFESIVSDGLPLVAGDSVVYRVDHFSCETHVFSVLPDGRVLIRGCRDGTRPEAVARGMLRVARYPVENAIIAPTAGDVVLVIGGVGSAPADAMRAVIVGVESTTNVRVRPLRVAPSALAIDTHELVVNRARLLSVQRPAHAGAPVLVPMPEGPFVAGDRLRLRDAAGGVSRDVVVADPAPTNEATTVRVAALTPGAPEGGLLGAPFEASRGLLEARVLRASDSVEAGAIVFERAAGTAVPTRAVVVHDTDRQEVCVVASGSDPATRCHDVPKTALVCVSCPLD